MIAKLLPLAVLLILVPLSAACSCPDLTFKQRYRNAAVVIRAKVLSSVKLPRTGPIGGDEYRFKLKTLELFKGCSPGRVFYARSIVNGGLCSVVLTKGSELKVQLPKSPEMQKAFPMKFYNFFGCYDTATWKNLSRKEMRFLGRQADRKRNACKA